MGPVLSFSNKGWAMAVTNKSKFTINDDVIAKKRENGDVILVKLDDNDIYFTINGLSVEVWEKLEKGKSLEEIEVNLTKKYPTDKVKIKKLLIKFVADLTKNKILAIAKK